MLRSAGAVDDAGRGGDELEERRGAGVMEAPVDRLIIRRLAPASG